MLIGVNVTAPVRFKQAEAFWDAGLIDYIELMLDNFLHVDPVELARRIDGRPVGIHIMSSRFLHLDRTDLVDLAGRMRRVMASLHPLYVSDHLGIHEIDGQLLPDLEEVDYADAGRLFPLVEQWRDLLDDGLILENYSSYSCDGCGQIEFFEHLAAATEVHPLVDFSNAVVAEFNGADRAARWLTGAFPITAGHISGYRPSSVDTNCLVDSHDVRVSEDSWALLRQSISLGRTPRTLTVERDAGSVDDWFADLRYAKQIAASVGTAVIQ